MGSPLAVALGGDPAPVQMESWTTPDLLGYAHAEESVDLQSICDLATSILFPLSGRKFGVRHETVRPAAGQGSCGWGRLNPSNFTAMEWLMRYQRNDGAPSYLLLKAPVQAVSEVKVDGQVLDASQYQLYDNRKLVRMQNDVGETLSWPIYQRLELPDTEFGTFSISYSWGRPVPIGGRLAAQVFATELAKYINNEDSLLSDRAIAVNRQGVSVTIDVSEFLKERRTGIYLPDIWLGSVNPTGARSRPTISSPESIDLARPT